MPHHRLLGPLVAALVLVPSAPALAAPVTVDVRVEGPTRTLVEQQVTVDVRPFKFSDSAQTYRCDGTAGNGGSSAVASPTRGGALTEASVVGGFELLGTFSTQFGSPSFTRINGESIPPFAAENKYLVELKNGEQSGTGACGDPIATGDDVLFAYGDGTEPLLRLAGPATVRPGESATLTVTDQGTRQPVAAASVAGGSTTADGRVTTAPLTQRGPQSFKASKPGAIRSNAVAVCVTDGADGFCGTTAPGQSSSTTAAPAVAPGVPVSSAADTIAAFAKIGSIAEGRRFARGRGPRVLSGKVDADASGVKDVRLRLSRTDAGRCSRFDGVRERLVAARRCGVRNARTFSVGDATAFSYLLPARLPRGRYVLDVIVVDKAGNQTRTYQRGRNRVVFRVA